MKEPIARLLRVLRMPIKGLYLLCFILLLGLSFYLFYPKVENFFIFFPDTSFDFTPEEMRLDYRDVFFNSVDGKKLHGWFFPLKEKGPVLLFFHGNAGNISHRLDNIRLLLEIGVQVFIIDYRGYGKSRGRPSEMGVYRDGLAAYDYLAQKKRIPHNQIILFGRSLGAATAVEVALNRKVKSIILESAFTSTKGMAKTMVLFSLLSPLLPANYNNLGKIEQIQTPKLIVHGTDDEIVPFSMGERLFEVAKSPKYFYPIQRAGHNDTYEVGGRRYFETLAAFVKNSRI